ncbi:flagellar type III secretion system pore protein FliP [Niveispirillum sp. BGYR6]|uniref:flagellar type III secretion system pore protein FliP n=1 Tax=Niveispirillum sp. BGYR6 TaxID=2971249 RepID=UPI0022B9A027|nr:flagellar type III secretion system pore protein FliP [Niveispirillum sp. BGYR6]MDG5496637.1 flagellar type III secretion system pore protein FliP [Niveispirillum sp. BGYR6]
MQSPHRSEGRPLKPPPADGGFGWIGAFALAAGLALLLLAGPADAQSITLDAGTGGASFSGRLVQIMALVTVLSVAPGLLVMVTSFTRIVVVLSLLRSALGLQQTPPNMVLVGLGLLLTAYIMGPTMDRAWTEGVQPLVDGQITEEQALERTVDPFRQFMKTHVRPKDLDAFQAFSQLAGSPAPAGVPKGPEAAKAEPGLRTLVAAFVISELRRAFEIGFLLFLPFLVIDMIVAAVLMAMGMMMLPPVVISLPFKIIFFVLVDGWLLVAQSLVRSYGGGG